MHDANHIPCALDDKPTANEEAYAFIRESREMTMPSVCVTLKLALNFVRRQDRFC